MKLMRTIATGSAALIIAALTAGQASAGIPKHDVELLLPQKDYSASTLEEVNRDLAYAREINALVSKFIGYTHECIDVNTAALKNDQGTLTPQTITAMENAIRECSSHLPIYQEYHASNARVIASLEERQKALLTTPPSKPVATTTLSALTVRNVTVSPLKVSAGRKVSGSVTLTVPAGTTAPSSVIVRLTRKGSKTISTTARVRTVGGRKAASFTYRPAARGTYSVSVSATYTGTTVTKTGGKVTKTSKVRRTITSAPRTVTIR